MKAYLINALLFGGIFLGYRIGLFDLIGSQTLKWAVYFLVVILLILGLFVFGNPFRKGDENDKK